MSLTNWRRERAIQRTLRALSRQRVGLILSPGDVWVVERAVPRTKQTAEHLTTCLLRGWVKVIENAVPHGDLTKDGQLPSRPPVFTEMAPIYGLTEGGWAVLNRSHAWVLATFAVAMASLIATLISLWLTWPAVG